MEMTFGKHKGVATYDLPDNYLAWICTQAEGVHDPALRNALMLEWDRRGSPQPVARSQQQSFSGTCSKCGAKNASAVMVTQAGTVCLPCYRA